HRRRERLPRRDRKLPLAASGRFGSRGGRPAGRPLGQDRRRLHQAPQHGRRQRPRPVLPHVGTGELQAAAPLRLRQRDSKIACRQAPAAQAGRRGIRGRRPTRNSSMSTMSFSDPRLAKLNGFSVELNEAKQRANIVLNRPPLNVIEMPQRDQLRLIFEALDEDERVRVIVLRAVGEHFSSGGNIKGFMEASPEHVSKLAWNIAAPARCAKPVIAVNRGYCFGVGFEISLACDFRIVSETCYYALPEQKLGQIPGSGGSARLQKMVGITRTKDIVMRSKRISG